MIFHPEYGVALKWSDPEKRIRKDTLIRQVFSLETKKENLGEELRILYVALTRAKEKLILTGFAKKEAIGGVSSHEGRGEASVFPCVWEPSAAGTGCSRRWEATGTGIPLKSAILGSG